MSWTIEIERKINERFQPKDSKISVVVTCWSSTTKRSKEKLYHGTRIQILHPLECQSCQTSPLANLPMTRKELTTTRARKNVDLSESWINGTFNGTMDYKFVIRKV